MSDVQGLAALDKVIHSQREVAEPQSWPAGGLLVWRGLPCRVGAPFKERGGLTAETWWLRVRRRGLNDRWQMPNSCQRGRSEDTGIFVHCWALREVTAAVPGCGCRERAEGFLVFAWRDQGGS